MSKNGKKSLKTFMIGEVSHTETVFFVLFDEWMPDLSCLLAGIR